MANSQDMSDVTFAPPAQGQAAAPPTQDTGDVTFAPSTQKQDMTDVTFTPPGQAQQPSLFDKAQKAAEFVIRTLPGIGSAHELAGVIHDWANKKMQQVAVQPEHPALAGAETFGLGALRSTAGMAAGATSPVGIATAAATAVAPEVMAPVLVGMGVHDMATSGIESWGDFKDPDKLEQFLMGASETVGGVTAGLEGVKGVVQRRAAKQFATSADEAYTNFQKAIPATKSTPYTEADYVAAHPYLERQHISGTPIESVEGLRDAADTSIERIEGQVHQEILKDPTFTVVGNPLGDVRFQLLQSSRASFMEEGLKSLDDFPQLTRDMTLSQADDIRKQLNAENKAVLRKNNYDISTAYMTDPAFAARQVAANSLRNMVYDALEKRGLPNARQLRLDEGSLIKVRNAAENQIFNAQKQVRATKPSLGRKVAQKTMGIAGAMGGAAVGETVGHPIAGATIGHEVGTHAAQALAPEHLTRDELVARSFETMGRPVPAAGRVTPETAVTGVAAGAGAGRYYFTTDDGSIHSVPDTPEARQAVQSAAPTHTPLE